MIIIELLRLDNAHIRPVRTTASSAKATGFSSDQWFLMPRNVWGSLGDWSGVCTQKNGPNGWYNASCVVVLVSFFVIDLTICLYFPSISAFSLHLCFALLTLYFIFYEGEQFICNCGRMVVLRVVWYLVGHFL
jgi:hypothetical protein